MGLVLILLNQPLQSRGTEYSARPDQGCVLALGAGRVGRRDCPQRKGGLSLPKNVGRDAGQAHAVDTHHSGTGRYLVNISVVAAAVPLNGAELKWPHDSYLGTLKARRRLGADKRDDFPGHTHEIWNRL